MRTLSVAFILCVFVLPSFANPPSSFSRAKKLAGIIFANHTETLYCHCHYDQSKDIDLASCGMREADKFSRAHHIEWEHMVPASTLGKNHACWTEDLCVKKNGERYHGRSCCRLVDKAFRAAEAELYNLWPANGLINQLRDNYAYAIVPFTGRAYGCNFIIDRYNRRIEPGDIAKGVVARASLFISDKYHIALSSEQKRLFESWNHIYPPTEWEKSWAKQVAEIEGYDNPYIS